MKGQSWIRNFQTEIYLPERYLENSEKTLRKKRTTAVWRRHELRAPLLRPLKIGIMLLLGGALPNFVVLSEHLRELFGRRTVSHGRFVM